MSGAMARRISYFKLEASDLDLLPMREEPIRRRARKPDAEGSGQISDWIGQHRSVAGANPDRNTRKTLAKGVISRDVVGVAVGKQDRLRRPIMVE